VNLSGILVTADVAYLGGVIQALQQLPGIEVRQWDAQTGRLVVLQEAIDIDSEVEGFMRIRQLPDVLTVDLICHYFGDDDAVAAGMPEPMPDRCP
jgi:nitrate reductase NapD